VEEKELSEMEKIWIQGWLSGLSTVPPVNTPTDKEILQEFEERDN